MSILFSTHVTLFFLILGAKIFFFEARSAPSTNKSFWILEMIFLLSVLTEPLKTRPNTEFNSSTSPYDITLIESFGTISPPTSIVLPASPVFV